MKSYKFNFKVVAATVVYALAAGCVQMPTEKQSVSDMRPQISFKSNPSDPKWASARVVLDNIDVGAVQDFMDGIATLKVLPGTHQLRIVQGGQVLHDERFYAGDGVNKSFILK